MKFQIRFFSNTQDPMSLVQYQTDRVEHVEADNAAALQEYITEQTDAFGWPYRVNEQFVAPGEFASWGNGSPEQYQYISEAGAVLVTEYAPQLEPVYIQI